MPKKRNRRPSPERLRREMERVETRLQDWLQSSPENARLFRADPLAAMRAAGLDIDDEIMLELERIMASIARKLK